MDEESSNTNGEESTLTETIVVAKPPPKVNKNVGAYKRHMNNTVEKMRQVVREELDSYKQRKAEEKQRKEQEEQQRKQKEEEERLFNEWKATRNNKKAKNPLPEPEEIIEEASYEELEPEPEPIKVVVKKKGAAPKTKKVATPKAKKVVQQQAHDAAASYYYNPNASIFDD